MGKIYEEEASHTSSVLKPAIDSIIPVLVNKDQAGEKIHIISVTGTKVCNNIPGRQWPGRKVISPGY